MNSVVRLTSTQCLCLFMCLAHFITSNLIELSLNWGRSWCFEQLRIINDYWWKILPKIMVCVHNSINFYSVSLNNNNNEKPNSFLNDWKFNKLINISIFWNTQQSSYNISNTNSWIFFFSRFGIQILNSQILNEKKNVKK